MIFDSAIDLAVRCVVVLACLSIGLAVICRINMLNSRRHKLSWIAMLVCMAAYAAGIALQVMAGQALTVHEAAGVAGLLLYVHISLANWKNAPPRMAEKGNPQ